MQLALHLRRWDWDVLEQELRSNPRRTIYLLALHRCEGWGEERADLRHAHNTAQALNLEHGGDLKAANIGSGLAIDEPTVDQIRARDDAFFGGT